MVVLEPHQNNPIDPEDSRIDDSSSQTEVQNDDSTDELAHVPENPIPADITNRQYRMFMTNRIAATFKPRVTQTESKTTPRLEPPAN